jgi:hypothetical protein
MISNHDLIRRFVLAESSKASIQQHLCGLNHGEPDGVYSWSKNPFQHRSLEDTLQGKVDCVPKALLCCCVYVLVSGGGQGEFTGCGRQWGGSSSRWGRRYGGVTSQGACDSLPSALKPGCRFRW